jgi:hypothetical protein
MGDAALPELFEQPYDDGMGGVEKGEQIDLSRIGHDCRARWRTGPVQGWQAVQIAVGVLDDGRWYVERIGQIHGRPRAYSTKGAAWQVVRNLMAAEPDADWERVPCYPSEQQLRRSGRG